MSVSFAGGLDALGGWRQGVSTRLNELARFLGEHDLLDGPATEAVTAMRARLAGEKLVLAFVAEFSRGKSELINAIFFADAGRRVLPAAPGRTTMCPVELAHDAGLPPQLALLPIETRLEGRSLADLRTQTAMWSLRELDVGAPTQLAEALGEVVRTKRVSIDEARALGFWDDESPSDNPPVADGKIEVPQWRHALINYPHPLLKRGLVVLDTPGLNAIGAEPELTLGLLPTAHATVFILGADTGVTKSDLAIWRDHLGSQPRSRYVVLNKIDTLVDPLTPPAVVRAQIEQQRQLSAQMLNIEPQRVFPMSARQALAARVAGDDEGLVASRLPELEAALATQLLPQRRQVLEHSVLGSTQLLETHLVRQLSDRRRQLAEQMLELRGLRGKSSAKLRLMLQRVEAEAQEFEQCTKRIHATRSVHVRMLKDALDSLATDRVRELMLGMQSATESSLLGFGARRAFTRLCAGLREQFQKSMQHVEEIHRMLGAAYSLLNADYGFSLALPEPPQFTGYVRDLELIERNYVQYLGLKQALRLSQPKFMEQFRRMLMSRVRVVFENASSELEMWNRSASLQIDEQLRERRRAFRRRHEAMERIQSAAGELEQRIEEFEKQDARLQEFETSLHERLDAVRERARAEVMPASAESNGAQVDIDLPRLERA